MVLGANRLGFNYKNICRDCSWYFGRGDSLSVFDELLHHGVELLWLVKHDHVSGHGDEFQIGLWYGSLHLAHLHQGDERVLEAVDQQGGNRNPSMEGGVP